MERSNKRRRVDEQPLSAFAAAKARSQKSSDITTHYEPDSVEGRNQDQADDGIITADTANEAEKLSDDGEDSAAQDDVDEETAGRQVDNERIMSTWMEASARTRSRDHRPSIIAVIGSHAAGTSRLCQIVSNSHFTISETSLGPVFLIDLSNKSNYSTGFNGHVAAHIHQIAVTVPSFSKIEAEDTGTCLTTIRAHPIIPSTSQEHPDHIVACAADLLRTCLRRAASDTSLSGVPPSVIVKFPEPSPGFGSGLAVALLRAIQPTKVLSLVRGPPKVIETISAACPPTVLVTLEPLPSAMPPALSDERLAEAVHLSRAGNLPLTRQRPLAVSFADGEADFLAAACYPDRPPVGKLASLLTASLVSIVELEDPTRFDFGIERESVSGIPCVAHATGGSTPVLEPAHSRLLGTALVRAVDLKRHLLEVLPVVEYHSIDGVPADRLVLVHGCFEAPKALLTEEALWRDSIQSRSDEMEGPIDDGLWWGEKDGTIPYVEAVKGEQGYKEQRWKSRKFNAGGAG